MIMMNSFFRLLSLFFIVFHSVSVGWASASVEMSVFPPERGGHSAALDPLGSRLVMFGGLAHTHRGDTWVLDLRSRAWRPVKTGSQPSPRVFHTATWDPWKRRLVVVGGYGPDGFLGDTWVLDATRGAWRRVTGRLMPSPRAGHTVTLDPERRQLVLVGGLGNTFLRDTWRFNLRTDRWRRVKSTQEPPPRAGHTATLDPAGSCLVIVGGKGRGFLSDAWRLDLKSGEWRVVGGALRPQPRAKHTATLDPLRHRLVVVGGGGGGYRGDVTWALDLATGEWTRLESPREPTPRAFHASVLDPEGERLFTLGGRTSRKFLGDVWVWRLRVGRWEPWKGTARRRRPFLAPRGGHSATLDPPRQRLLVFGGAAEPLRITPWPGSRDMLAFGKKLKYLGDTVIFPLPISGK